MARRGDVPAVPRRPVVRGLRWHDFFADYKPTDRAATQAQTKTQTKTQPTANTQANTAKTDGVAKNTASGRTGTAPDTAPDKQGNGRPSANAASARAQQSREADRPRQSRGRAQDGLEAGRRQADREADRRSRPTKPADEVRVQKAEHAKALRGAAAAIAKNMDASLTVPTATSVRAVPAKLLADNRIVINNHLQADPRRQGHLHPPDRLRDGPGARATTRT